VKSQSESLLFKKKIFDFSRGKRFIFCDELSSRRFAIQTTANSFKFNGIDLQNKLSDEIHDSKQF